MKAWTASLVLVGLLVGTAVAGGADGPKGFHRGTGIVVATAPGSITLREIAGSHVMTIDSDTRVLLSPDDRVGRIAAGDYIAEECAPDGRGGVTARRLTLYRPAWMEHASPEN